MSIAALIWRIYIRFHNFSPRKRLQGQNPIEYLRSYTPSSDEVEEVRERLKKQRDRSRRLQEQHPRRTDPGFRELVDGIITRHRFEIELDKAIKALLHFDESVIRNSDTAFHVASQRDAFQEGKRHFAYFMGIVRNKQKQIDGERAKEKVEHENAERRRAHERAIAKDRESKERELENDPESFVLRCARLLLIGRLQLLRGRFTEELRRGVDRLREIERATKSVLGKLSFTIRSWPDFSEDLKSRMVELLAEEFASERQPIAAASTEERRESPTPSETREITEESKQELMDMLSGLCRMPP